MAATLYSLITLKAAADDEIVAALGVARLPRGARLLELREFSFPDSSVTLLTAESDSPGETLWELARPLARTLGVAYYYQWDDRAEQIEFWRLGPEGSERLFLDHAGTPVDLDYEVRDSLGEELVQRSRAMAIHDFRGRYAELEENEDYTGLAEAVSLGEENANRWEDRLYELARQEMEEEFRRALLDAVILYETGIENDAFLGQALRSDRYPSRLRTFERRLGFLGLWAGEWVAASDNANATG